MRDPLMATPGGSPFYFRCCDGVVGENSPRDPIGRPVRTAPARDPGTETFEFEGPTEPIGRPVRTAPARDPGTETFEFEGGPTEPIGRPVRTAPARDPGTDTSMLVFMLRTAAPAAAARARLHQAELGLGGGHVCDLVRLQPQQRGTARAAAASACCLFRRLTNLFWF